MTHTRSSRALERLIRWSLDYPLSTRARYLAATLAIAVVAALRAALVTSLLPWLPFIPTILIIVLVLGEGPGVWASLFATLLAGLTIGSVTVPLWLTGPQWAASALFLAIALGIGRLAGELRASFHRTQVLNDQLAERGAFLSGILASSTDCIKVMDLDGRLTFMSEGGMKTMEVDSFDQVEGCPWIDWWHEWGRAEANEAIANARQGRTSHFIGQGNTFRGNPRWWDVSVSRIQRSDGTPDRILSVARDTTALMAAQQRQQLLNGELGHRLKNILALVQSVASQTIRQADSLESANQAFAARLAALGKATDVLTATAWQPATLRDVVDAGLTSIGGLAHRMFIDGPHVELSSQIALALTLALHELATNACKYGALSNDTGTVNLTWRNDVVENGAADRFSLVWQEAGGPAVTVPLRRGFGSRMIERSLRSYFRGEASLLFDPAGVVFRIDAPLPQAGAGTGD